MNYEELRDILSNLTLERPLGGALLTGGALGLGGYLLGPKVLHGIARRLPGGGGKAPPLTADQARTAKRRGAMLGAGLGVAPWVPLLAEQIQEQGLEGILDRYEGKSAAWNMDSGEVDADASKTIVAEDPYLPDAAKFFTNNIFDQSLQRAPKSRRLQGLLNGGDLIRGAVGAGLGYGAASVAGPMLRGLFGLPRGIQKKLSASGGLAGALLGSGIISGR